MSIRFSIKALTAFAVVALPAAAGASGVVHTATHRVQHSATHHRAYASRRAPVQVARHYRSDQTPPYYPPNAVRMPGYVFVPGVGILGESCDLPTSACPNEYRDVQ